MTEYEFRTATDDDLRLFWKTRVIPRMKGAHVCLADGEPIAVAGIILDPDYYGSWLDDGAKPMAFMDIGENFPKHLGFDAVRRMRDVLVKCPEGIYVQHDHKHPTAEKLLKALGFHPTGEWRRDMQGTGRHLEVWYRPASKGRD